MVQHANVDGKAKQVWKILVVLSEGMDQSAGGWTITPGSSEVEILSLFAAWTTEVGDAAMSVADCAKPLLRVWWVSCLSPSLTKRAMSSCTTDKKSQLPHVMRLQYLKSRVLFRDKETV